MQYSKHDVTFTKRLRCSTGRWKVSGDHVMLRRYLNPKLSFCKAVQPHYNTFSQLNKLPLVKSLICCLPLFSQQGAALHTRIKDQRQMDLKASDTDGELWSVSSRLHSCPSMKLEDWSASLIFGCTSGPLERHVVCWHTLAGRHVVAPDRPAKSR